MSEFFTSFAAFIPQIGIFLGITYLLIVLWVAKDISQRSTSVIAQALSIIVVIAIPFMGIFIYLLLRPELLVHKEIREFLSHQ